MTRLKGVIAVSYFLVTWLSTRCLEMVFITGWKKLN